MSNFKSRRARKKIWPLHGVCFRFRIKGDIFQKDLPDRFDFSDFL